MTYKEIAITLCEGFLDMPCGCEGCPLYNEDNLDDDGNMVCELKELRNEERIEYLIRRIKNE